jgi:hypothetical protein
MNDQELIGEMQRARAERLGEGWGTYKPRNPIASDLHPCLRYMVGRQIAGHLRPKPGPEAMETIENGNVKEGPMIRQLQDEGWKIVQEQNTFEIRQPLYPGGPKTLILRGSIDGKIGHEKLLGRELIPFDTKDTGQYVLDQMETENDLREGPWTRKWYAQMQAYLLGEEHERGLIILGHRGRRKYIMVHLDYDFAEAFLQKCVETVKLVADLESAEVGPDRLDHYLAAVPYWDDTAECNRCWQKNLVCFPPEPGSLERSANRPDLEQDAERYLELQPLQSEYRKLHDRLKKESEGSPTTYAGGCTIKGEVKVRNIKAQAARDAYRSESWAIQVEKT